jgi:excinuclease ABC subunit A
VSSPAEAPLLKIRNAREHNLRGIDLDLPRDRLIVFTGVSGSGKSSLAFDTLHKEGQRRFMESLSAYARQFLGQMERPAVDSIEGLSPTVCIDQKTVHRNPRSTVGTITEVYDHLRLMMARLGTPRCPVCLSPVRRVSKEQVLQQIMALGDGRRALVLGPVVRERKGEYRKELEELARDGWMRVRVDGTVRRLDETIELARYERHTVEVVVDRLPCTTGERVRWLEAVESAAKLGKGSFAVLFEADEAQAEGFFEFSLDRACARHPDIAMPEMEPRLFSFNAPQGACSECSGLGALESFDPALFMNADLPLPEAFRVFNEEERVPFSRFDFAALSRVVRAMGAPLREPIGAWRREHHDALLYGGPAITLAQAVEKADGRVEIRERPWMGLIGVLNQAWQWAPYPGFERFRSRRVCPSCDGHRLNPIARAVTFRDHGLSDFVRMSVAEAHRFFAEFELQDEERVIGAAIIDEIRGRLSFLHEVGLDYLTLDRSAATLSGGEGQRIRLASQVGAGLQGVTYVLDEPSIGLHPRDNRRLIQALVRLRDRGNTLIVVEHDAETVLAADFVVEIGPGAGREGGELVAFGDVPTFLASGCLTAQYLRGDRAISARARPRPGTGKFLGIREASVNNLQLLSVDIPLGTLTVVTGVSGSGKSTLVFEVLEASLLRHFSGEAAATALVGVEAVQSVITITQQPIGRTPRSNPATYTGAMDLIRELFASTSEAQARGYKKGRFSFNVAGGRCEGCEGAGVKLIEMQFLPDVEVVCERCGGRRFNEETLEVRWRGRSIRDVLEMPIREAVEFFAAQPKLHRILRTLESVGLGYIALGQSATTLSGGEAQRLKLATELHRPPRGHAVYLLDEPTTGLHFADVERLLDALHRLVDLGHTVVVVEHNIDVIRCADHILDLGPEGGAGGGRLVAAGAPADVADVDSPTGRALREALSAGPSLAAEANSNSGVPATESRVLRIEGARQHNLQNISVSIPHGQLTVITGPSGSGKTSLAFDTIFSEGQRRYVESLSTYARRFLGRLERAPVDRVEGLAPAIAIDQHASRHNPRSTVATVTEIHDVLRLLYARVGDTHCPHCGRLARGWDANAAAKALLESNPGPGWVLAETVLRDDPSAQRLALLGEGWQRLLRTDRSEALLEDDASVDDLRGGAQCVIDRLDPSRVPLHRLSEAVDAAFRVGHGAAAFVPKKGVAQYFSVRPECPTHGVVLEGELTPRHFSFNARVGACLVCDGVGRGSRAEGTEVVCGACGGGRLRPELLAVRIGGLGIHELSRRTIAEARAVVDAWAFSTERELVAQRPREELKRRLQFLDDVGLGYLTLDRSAETLSGGEAQRIRLASQLGTGLTGVIYVLDEPTVGLHARDTDRLLATLEGLRDLGNTLVVVEHDLETMRRADYLLDLGPGAGNFGGHLLASGTPTELMAHPDSPTGAWLAGRIRIPPRSSRRRARSTFTLRSPSGNNLRCGDIVFPTGVWVGVTGVSGSGKSTLAMDTLAPALQSSLGQSAAAAPHGGLHLGEPVKQVIVVDQSPIGRTPRSTPATYCGIMDLLRAWFAETLGAKERGWGPGRFSFNNAEGRCSVCEGRGATLVEMHFLPDVWVNCDACGGRRFDPVTLDVRWQGRSIADVLAMRADEALELFQHHRALSRSLRALVDVGLGYLALGQPATTLSGGEAQRVKLAAELGSRRGHCVYLLDEPTTGLHLSDVAQLTRVFHGLVDAGHTLITVEHHLDLLAQADWLIELGPEGGSAGGERVGEGTPDDFLNLDTPTGRALQRHVSTFLPA